MTNRLPTRMQTMTIEAGALVPATMPTPKPAEGEVLIRVAYVGVNRADMMQLAGQYAPPAGASPLLGLEVSGRIAALGQGATGFAVGDEVCALLSGGGYAEYVAVPQGQVLKLPTGMDLKTAASLPEAAATSMMALVSEGNLTAGERVLIHGGTSGVGILMTQIAKYLGAEVFATVGGAQKVAFINQFNLPLPMRGRDGVGAQPTHLSVHDNQRLRKPAPLLASPLMGEGHITPIDHTIAPFAQQLMALTNHEGVDLIIDTLGAPQLATHLGVLRRGGRLISLAMLEGSEIPAGTKMTRLVMNHLSWRGATLRSRSTIEKATLMDLVRAKVWPGIENGAIKPQIDGCFSLNEAKKALNRMQERLHMGKILLEVAPK